MISPTSIVSFNDTRHNIVETEAESHDNRLGSLLLLWPMGVRSYGWGFESFVWGRGCFLSISPLSQ